jgi:hypothetical protein
VGTEDQTPDGASTVGLRARPALLAFAVCLLATLVSLGLVAGLTALEQASHPPACYGIGWGCVPGPLTTAALYGFFLVLPGVLVIGLVLAGTVRLRTDRARRLAAVVVASVACALALGFPLGAYAFGRLA